MFLGVINHAKQPASNQAVVQRILQTVDIYLRRWLAELIMALVHVLLMNPIAK